MAQGKVSKATKKFQAKHLTRTIENRRIQKKNKDKYNKNKTRNALAKAVANQDGTEEQTKRPVKGKASVLEGMSMDEFLETGGIGGDVLQGEEADGGNEESEDELEKSHKAGLEGLWEKDPLFYEFLKQNDKGLLEVDPEELQVDEEGEEEGPIEGGLTVETLSRWETLLKEKKSLATLKKVLIAVKNAAASVTGEEIAGGNAKYVLTDPEGILYESGLT
jgi:nucleolar complex protein 2